MRAPWLILLMFVASQAAVADETIEWSPQRPLSWDDFKGRVPDAADRKRVAATTASLPWSYGYTIAITDRDCRYTITEIRSSAEFHPDASWVRPDHATSAVLAHEQGHFDIAQIFNERLQSASASLIGSRQTCQGRNRRRAAQDAERDIAERIGTIYEDIWRQYRARQEQYDRDTGHGTDPAAQARWSREIEHTLQLTRQADRIVSRPR